MPYNYIELKSLLCYSNTVLQTHGSLGQLLEDLMRMVALDLLVDVEPGTTLFDLGGLQIDLEELIGVKVDVLTAADLSPRFRAQVISEAKAV